MANLYYVVAEASDGILPFYLGIQITANNKKEALSAVKMYVIDKGYAVVMFSEWEADMTEKGSKFNNGYISFVSSKIYYNEN